MTRGLRRKVRGRSLLRTTTFLSNRAISFFPNETERVNLHWTREKLGGEITRCILFQQCSNLHIETCV